MSYQNTVNTIRAAANASLTDDEDVQTGLFVHGRRVDASLTSISTQFPLIVLYPFTTTPGESTNSNSLLMGFYMQDSPTSSPEQREAIIASMDTLSDSFLSMLYENKLVRVTALVKEPQYQQHSGTVSGYAIRFNFEDMQQCVED